MATIVEHTPSGGVYVLLGTGFGMSQTSKPHWFFGDWVAEKESGQIAMVAVCDFKGQIGWYQSHELRVVSIDGATPEACLGRAPNP